jgi:hypothetical protein
MNLDVNPFLVDMIEFGEKRVLVRTDQAATTTWKNVMVSDDLRNRMMKPWQPEVGVWKKNIWRKCWPEWRPTCSFLMEKYTQERCESVFHRLGDTSRGGHQSMETGMEGRYLGHNTGKPNDLSTWARSREWHDRITRLVCSTLPG